MNVHSKIRFPAVAGHFYPESPRLLDQAVEQALAAAEAPSSKALIRALIVPHAGYSFSGSTAGSAYGLLRETPDRYDRAVILAPSHTVPFKGIALGAYRAYRTPLGEVEIDEVTCRALIGASSLFTERTDVHQHEHSLEVQLPFIQKLLPGAVLVPAICGQLDEDRIRAAAELLCGHRLWEPRTLWVVSSDFTHYGRAFDFLPFTYGVPDKLRELDYGAIAEIKNRDASGFLNYCARTGATICGSVPIAILLHTLLESGAAISPGLVKYHNSARQTDDFSHCVSYVSMTFTDSGTGPR